MTEIHFWGECKKTLERDLPVEEYSTWIAPLTLEQNNGSTPPSYSVLAPNKFISDWVEDNYGLTIKERISAITSNRDLNINFEIPSIMETSSILLVPMTLVFTASNGFCSQMSICFIAAA